MSAVGMSPRHAHADFTKLKRLIMNMYGSGAVTLPKVIGPDSGGCTHTLTSTLGGFGRDSNALDVVNFHHYTLGNGRRGCAASPCTVQELVSAAVGPITDTVIDGYLQELQTMGSATFAGLPLWIGEGAGYFGQGTLDRAFVACYSWLNILRVGGLKGVSLFVKQNVMDLFECLDCRVGDVRYKPTAQYWFAYLFKRFMGTRVLHTHIDALDRGLLVAARSLRNSDTGSPAGSQTTRSFVLAVANTKAASLTLRVHIDTQPPHDDKPEAGVAAAQEGYQCSLYELAPRNGVMGSSATINGKDVAVTADGRVPLSVLVPVRVPCARVPLSAWGIGFIVAHKHSGH
jgi:hypothetical protein